MRAVLSWIDGYGVGAGGGHVSNPSWELVADKIEKIGVGSGTVALDVGESEGRRASALQVVAENGKFWLTLGQDDGEDWMVREYVGKVAPSSLKCTIQSYEVDWSSVCVSLKVVIEIFEEFFATGDVSESLMR